MTFLERLGRSALFRLDPETAHGLSITALRSGAVPACPEFSANALRVQIAGLDFPNPVGLAAGYDKNAEVPDAILRLGFGFTEVGTVTPRPQPGNPKPRIFRLVEDAAIINRLGFNNEGHGAALARLEARRGREGIVGVNIGANKDSEDFVADYVAGMRVFQHLASYFTVNISSPNTPGLRNLQAAEALKRLLDAVFETREVNAARAGARPPVFLKLAPDLTMADADSIASVITGSALDGVILSNTTLSRTGLKNRQHRDEAGGLSGRPLFERSTIMLARFRQRLPENLPLIGVGGIDNADSALKKIEAGASLVQLYTGMVYQGPWLASRIVRDLASGLEREGVADISRISGRKTRQWAELKLEEEKR